MRVLEWLVLLVGIGAVVNALQDVRAVTFSDPFLFLRLFTHASEPLPSFVALLSFLVPLVAIGLGFDAINSEFNRRTLSRVLSQPIYRDALLLGKFLGGLATLAVSLLALWLLIFGLGLVVLGVPPNGEEVVRAFGFLGVTLAYAGFWLGLAILLSAVFRSTATAALLGLGLWLFLTLLWGMLVPQVIKLLVSAGVIRVETVQGLIEVVGYQQMVARLSPNTLFIEAMQALLEPSTRTLAQLFMPNPAAVPNAPLPFVQSVLLVWPQITGLVAAVIVMFAITYVVFQRQEVRA
jgi:ABC-2 type transport system permease protein